MNEDYPFTSLEYAKMLGISKECLRGRRRAGKLEGEYITKDNNYYWKRVRPCQLLSTPKNPPKRIRRRGVSYTGETLNYRNHGLQNHNEMKMLLKLQKKVDPKLLAVVPEALALYLEKKKTEAQSKARDPIRTNHGARSGRTKNYGSGIYDPRTVPPVYTSLKPKTKKKFTYYY